jgi:predicted nucleic acid-binding protein
VASLRAQRRRVPVLDALIAATAIVEQIPIVTQDRDYEAIPDVQVIRV